MLRKSLTVFLVLIVGAVFPINFSRHVETRCYSSTTVVVCEKKSGKFLPAANPNITSLHITASDMTFLTADDILRFRNLETINIAGCTIPVELGNILSRLKKLEVLEISDSNVGEDFALGDMKSLVSLSLEGNRLTRLSEGALGSLPLLEALHLARNAIAEVEAGALEALPRLRELDLSRNRLDAACDHPPVDALRLWLRRAGARGRALLRLGGNPLCDGAALQGCPQLEDHRAFLRRACGEGGAQDEGESEVEGEALSAPEGQTEDRVGGSGKGPAEGEAAEAAASVSVRSSRLVGLAGGQRPAQEQGPLVVAATSLPRLILIAFVVGLSLIAVFLYLLHRSRGELERGGSTADGGTAGEGRAGGAAPVFVRVSKRRRVAAFLLRASEKVGADPFFRRRAIARDIMLQATEGEGPSEQPLMEAQLGAASALPGAARLIGAGESRPPATHPPSTDPGPRAKAARRSEQLATARSTKL